MHRGPACAASRAALTHSLPADSTHCMCTVLSHGVCFNLLSAPGFPPLAIVCGRALTLAPCSPDARHSIWLKSGDSDGGYWPCVIMRNRDRFDTLPAPEAVDIALTPSTSRRSCCALRAAAPARMHA